VPQLFEDQVERTPEAVAVVFEDEELSYRELNRRANQVAHYLGRRGIGPEVRVGICMERSLELVVGILGILKAGAAYVPLDPGYPRERLAYILDDAQVRVLLTQKHLSGMLSPHPTEVVCLDLEWDAIAREADQRPEIAVNPHNLAYVIYTSGSTGSPKGIMVEHRGLCNLAEFQAKMFGIGSTDRVLQFFSINFDAWMWEFLLALAVGATLHIAPEQIRLSSSALAEYLRHHDITAISLLPSVLTTLPADSLPKLRTVIVGGERCSAALVGLWSKRHRFFNVYGPTEASVAATLAECEGGTHRPAIGRPIANMTAFVLDLHLRSAPIGIPGELYIGGIGLARGYINRPDLTAESFIPDPFSRKPGARLLKSGDRARILPTRDIDFLGRLDSQVKIRGVRIELKEIEMVLQGHEAIRDCLIMACEDNHGDERLIGYLVLREPSASVTIDDIRDFLRKQLPEYMVPVALILLDELPRTSNGKVDVKKLPAANSSHSESKEPSVFPRDPTEQALARIWIEVLDIKQISVNANFFDLGGHSLNATQAALKIGKVFEINLPVSSIFRSPTIAKLAHVVTEFQQGQSVNNMPGGSLKQRDLDELLATLPKLSNAQVDALLMELLSEVDEADLAGLVIETPRLAAGENQIDFAGPQRTFEELLEDLDRLSDQAVDSLITELSG
jgi:amino acid adenylation domain-containing protein